MTSAYRVNYHLRTHKRDDFIEFLKSILLTSFVLHAKPRQIPDGQTEESQKELCRTKSSECFVDSNLKRYADSMLNVETLVNEHIAMQERGTPGHSRLRRLVPTIGTFFTPLPLQEAFLIANQKFAISARRCVPPSFNDIRRILNTAQTLAIAPSIKLITFDGDMTLYADGADFAHDSALVSKIVGLLRYGIQVAVVTAAGYAGNPSRYEARLSGLLAGFLKAGLSKEEVERFWVLGGECNFLFQCSLDGENDEVASGTKVGAGVGEEDAPSGDVDGNRGRSGGKDSRRVRLFSREGQSAEVRGWTEKDIKRLLDCAEKSLRGCIQEMRMEADVIRKVRAVGMIPRPGVKFGREQLDECVLSTQQKLEELPNTTEMRRLPYCAFNGGSDVWVDIGNKLLGVQGLQGFLNAKPKETLHVGDQFLSTGNDHATRAACCTLWVTDPEETLNALIELDGQLQKRKNGIRLDLSECTVLKDEEAL